MTRWGDLRRGDRIVCPGGRYHDHGAGLTERVTRVQRGPRAGWVRVRTSRHDHNRRAADQVRLATNDQEVVT